MTAKFSRTTAPRLNIADGAQLTFPNSDWYLPFVIVMDGTMAGYGPQYLFSTGAFAAAGCLQICFNPTDAGSASAGKLFVNFDTTTAATVCSGSALVANGKYAGVVQRSNNVISIRHCPTLSVAPVDGSAVIQGAATLPLTKALDGPLPLTIGSRADNSNASRWDHSLARIGVVYGTLTDFELAKLAYGMELTDIGKSPAIYIRLNDATDITDRGSQANTVVATNPVAPGLINGSSPGFGYVPATSAPVFTSAPAIIGTPQVGSTVSYTRGEASGSPAPTMSQQWMINGVAISGATGLTYIPVVGDAGKTLTVVQTASNSEGSATSTSPGAVVAAAANAVSMADIPTEQIFSLASLAATTAAVPLAITYTGTQPTSVEYQLYGVDRATVRQAWTSAGATIAAGGTATASPLMPKHAEKYTIALRTKDSSGNVLATSTISTFRFGIGVWLAHDGSSSSATWFGSGSGGSYTPNTASTSYADPNGFRNFDNNGVASQAAIYYAQQFGCCIGMLSVGVGGTTVNELANTSSSKWLATSAGLTLLGNKIAAYICSSGSNDASNNYLVTSAEQHLGKQRAIIANVRAQCNLPNLPVFWSGMNSRPGSSGNAAGQDPMSDWVRTAENILGYDANVYHISALDFTVGSDGVHLIGTGNGYPAQMARIQYIVADQLKNGIYRRGPRITAFTFLGNAVTASLEYRQPGASDFTPTTGAVGFTVTDASGTPGVVSVTRQDATHPKITFDRALVAPVVAKFLSGGAPSTAAPIYDNATVPLPMTMEAVLATTEGAPPADTTAPTLTAASATVTGATTATGAVTTNEAGGILYYLANTSATATEAQVLAGSSKAVTAAGAQSVSLTGLPVSSTLYLHFLHADGAATPNKSAVANTASFTTQAAPSTVTGVTVTPSTATLTGGTVDFDWAINGTNSPSQAATVTTSLGTITSAGVLTVAQASSVQSGTVTVTSTQDPTKSGTATFTVAALATTPPAQQNGFTPSVSRTVKVMAGKVGFEVGSFWTLGANASPVGVKDPNSTIDIMFDWTNWLADIGNAQLSAVDFILAPGIGVAVGIPSTTGGTVFVSGGVIGQNLAITCRITTATTPARVEDRTVVLQIKDQ